MRLLFVLLCVALPFATAATAQTVLGTSILERVLDGAPDGVAEGRTHTIDSLLSNVVAAVPTRIENIRQADGTVIDQAFGAISASIDITLSAGRNAHLRLTEDRPPDPKLGATTASATPARAGDLETLLLGASLTSGSNTVVLGQNSDNRGLITVNAAVNEGPRDAEISVSAMNYTLTTGNKKTSIIGASSNGTNLIASGIPDARGN